MKEENNTVKVDKTIEKLNTIVVELGEVFRAIDEDEDNPHPFVTVEYEDMKELRDELIPLLKDYKHWLQEYEDGNMQLNIDGEAVQLNQPVYGRGENAPAYKKSIDEKMIYKLWCKNISINEIARRVGCSADTVKRRMKKIQLRIERGEKI